MNDPDVIFIRTENCTLTENQKYLISGVSTIFGSQLMYSDDPGKADEDEKLMTNVMLEYDEKYKDEDFGITQLSDDTYKIYSKSGIYKGTINLKPSKAEIKIRGILG